MANTKKKMADLSPTAEDILKIIKEAGENGILYSDIKEQVEKANPSQLTALATRGLIVAEKVDVEVLKKVKTKVNKYTIKE